MVLAVMDERLYHKRGFQSVWFTLAQGCSAEPMSESGATWCPWPVGQGKFSSCSEGFQHAHGFQALTKVYHPPLQLDRGEKI